MLSLRAPLVRPRAPAARAPPPPRPRRPLRSPAVAAAADGAGAAEAEAEIASVVASLCAVSALGRVTASGRRRSAPLRDDGGSAAAHERLDARVVALGADDALHLQATRYTRTQAFTSNTPLITEDGSGGAAGALALDVRTFRNWRVEDVTGGAVLEVQFSKRDVPRIVRRPSAALAGPAASLAGDAAPTKGERSTGLTKVIDGSSVRDGALVRPHERVRPHDRTKRRLLAEDAPVLRAVGVADAQGRVKPSRRAKYVQVCEFLRVLDSGTRAALKAGRLPPPTRERPWRMADLGCGNAYLTLAAYTHLCALAGELCGGAEDAGSDSDSGAHSEGDKGVSAAGAHSVLVEAVGVDLKRQARERNSALARELGWDRSVRFVEGLIGPAPLAFPTRRSEDAEEGGFPDIVLALHACDTASDDALAAGVRWRAPLVLAAPCCHKQVQRQLERAAKGKRGGASKHKQGVSAKGGAATATVDTSDDEGALTEPALMPLLKQGLLRERLGDVVADASRAHVLRLLGWRVDAIEFVDATHTPKNVLLRCTRTDAPAPRAAWEEWDAMRALLRVAPHLAELLAEDLAAARPAPR